MPPKRNIVRGTKRQVSGDADTPSMCASVATTAAKVEKKSLELDASPISPVRADLDESTYEAKELEHRDILTIRIHYTNRGALAADSSAESVVQIMAYSPLVRDTDPVFDLIRTICWSTVLSYSQYFGANIENNWRERVARNMVLFILYDTLCEQGLSHGEFGVTRLFIHKDGSFITQEEVALQILASHADYSDKLMCDLSVSKILESLEKFDVPVLRPVDVVNLKQQCCYVKREAVFNLYQK